MSVTSITVVVLTVSLVLIVFVARLDIEMSVVKFLS